MSKATDNAKNMALGGVMAALAVVIMCMGGLIPLATYVCPAMRPVTQIMRLAKIIQREKGGKK